MASNLNTMYSSVPTVFRNYLHTAETHYVIKDGVYGHEHFAPFKVLLPSAQTVTPTSCV